jgi:hypothetical protein
LEPFLLGEWQRRSKKIGTVSQYPTNASAWRAAKALRDAVENQVTISNAAPPTVNTLVERYRQEKMPQRFKPVDKWRKRVGVETAFKLQTKDLTEHGQHC